MKQIIITALLAFSTSFISAQRPKGEFAVTPYLRMDKYPSFTFKSGPANTHTVSLEGTSAGISADYIHPVSKKIFLNGRIGYQRYSFNKIAQQTAYGSTISARPTTLQLLPGAFIGFDSDKYFYNTICTGLGIGRNFNLSQNITFRTGCAINNYITFSQNYHITYDHPDNPIENPYKSTKTRQFAFEGIVQFSAVKSTGRYRLGPAIMLPVFTTWKTDEVFTYEKNSGSRSKWFKGIGAGFTFCYPLTAKNN